MFTPAPKRSTLYRRRQHGAAALILLMMVSLGAASVLISAYRGHDRLRREQTTLQTMSDAQQALIGYAITHGRLPRPARQAEQGWESAAVCLTEQSCTGFLPWATLGLSPAYVRGKPLRYVVTPAFAATDADLSAAVGTKTIVARSGRQFLYLVGGATCARFNQCAPAVLIASGKYQGLPGAVDQASNDVAAVHFIQRPGNDDETALGGLFDDVVTAVPYDQLVRRTAIAAVR